MKNETSPNSQANIIIGIGASAGGLEALQQFLANMSCTSSLAFVVVQHLSPDYKSLLAEILAKHTRMTVVQVENEMKIQPNHVYLIPPKNNMIVADGHLLLKEYVHSGVNHPIDVFFHSLAEEMKERSIGVILSGTGTDGTNGIKTIKEAGGLVIVQEPTSAKFDGMPKSAINTGLVDFVLTPHQIADEILNYVNYPTVVHDDHFQLFSDEEMLAKIYLLLKHVSKIDYTHYKRTTILRRIERRMVVTHQESLSNYVGFLGDDPDEARILAKEILIGVTNFFRDASYFETLKQTAITSILKKPAGSEPIRVWSAGCSTGEEAYSIAMLFQEVMDELEIKRDVKIFATDVDVDAVEFAGKGVYSSNIMDDIPVERLQRFFIKKGDSYTINKEIRKMIVFAPQNVFQDPPFGKLDMIVCRNVMIYFQPVLQKNLFSIFNSALKNDGFLFLGKSETAGEFSEVFIPICPLEKIYRHNVDGHSPDLVPITYSTPKIYPSQAGESDNLRKEKAFINSDEPYVEFLEDFMPPAVVINDSNNLVHIFGDFGKFLHMTKGEVNLNIFRLITDKLSLVVSTALNKARVEKSLVTYTDIAVTNTEGKEVIIDLTVAPFLSRRGVDLGLTAIVFGCKDERKREGFVEQYDINKTAAQRIIDLEHELQDSQEHLKATIGELETVNEELQAANEELLTANEELQSSNEELQSVNEELYTVNAEYQQKLEELTDLNNDMSNFLSSTMIGILFIDNSLNIRKFTDYIAREFNILEYDIGRPLQILSHNFLDINLVQDANVVLKNLTSIEREIHSVNDKHYTMRISPYRTTDNSIKGLVITIIDSLNGDTKPIIRQEK